MDLEKQILNIDKKLADYNNKVEDLSSVIKTLTHTLQQNGIMTFKPETLGKIESQLQELTTSGSVENLKTMYSDFKQNLEERNELINKNAGILEEMILKTRTVIENKTENDADAENINKKLNILKKDINAFTVEVKEQKDYIEKLESKLDSLDFADEFKDIINDVSASNERFLSNLEENIGTMLEENQQYDEVKESMDEISLATKSILTGIQMIDVKYKELSGLFEKLSQIEELNNSIYDVKETLTFVSSNISTLGDNTEIFNTIDTKFDEIYGKFYQVINDDDRTFLKENIKENINSLLAKTQEQGELLANYSSTLDQKFNELNLDEKFSSFAKTDEILDGIEKQLSNVAKTDEIIDKLDEKFSAIPSSDEIIGKIGNKLSEFDNSSEVLGKIDEKFTGMPKTQDFIDGIDLKLSNVAKSSEVGEVINRIDEKFEEFSSAIPNDDAKFQQISDKLEEISAKDSTGKLLDKIDLKLSDVAKSGEVGEVINRIDEKFEEFSSSIPNDDAKFQQISDKLEEISAKDNAEKIVSEITGKLSYVAKTDEITEKLASIPSADEILNGIDERLSDVAKSGEVGEVINRIDEKFEEFSSSIPNDDAKFQQISDKLDEISEKDNSEKIVSEIGEKLSSIPSSDEILNGIDEKLTNIAKTEAVEQIQGKLDFVAQSIEIDEVKEKLDKNLSGIAKTSEIGEIINRIDEKFEEFSSAIPNDDAKFQQISDKLEEISAKDSTGKLLDKIDLKLSDVAKSGEVGEVINRIDEKFEEFSSSIPNDDAKFQQISDKLEEISAKDNTEKIMFEIDEKLLPIAKTDEIITKIDEKFASIPNPDEILNNIQNDLLTVAKSGEIGEIINRINDKFEELTSTIPNDDEKFQQISDKLDFVAQSIEIDEIKEKIEKQLSDVAKTGDILDGVDEKLSPIAKIVDVSEVINKLDEKLMPVAKTAEILNEIDNRLSDIAKTGDILDGVDEKLSPIAKIVDVSEVINKLDEKLMPVAKTDEILNEIDNRLSDIAKTGEIGDIINKIDQKFTEFSYSIPNDDEKFQQISEKLHEIANQNNITEIVDEISEKLVPIAKTGEIKEELNLKFDLIQERIEALNAALEVKQEEFTDIPSINKKLNILKSEIGEFSEQVKFFGNKLDNFGVDALSKVVDKQVLDTNNFFNDFDFKFSNVMDGINHLTKESENIPHLTKEVKDLSLGVSAILTGIQILDKKQQEFTTVKDNIQKANDDIQGLNMNVFDLRRQLDNFISKLELEDNPALKEQLTRIEENLSQIEKLTNIQEGLSRLDKIDDVEGKLNGINDRFGNIEESLSQLDKLNEIDGRLTQIKGLFPDIADKNTVNRLEELISSYGHQETAIPQDLKKIKKSITELNEQMVMSIAQYFENISFIEESEEIKDYIDHSRDILIEKIQEIEEGLDTENSQKLTDLLEKFNQLNQTVSEIDNDQKTFIENTIKTQEEAKFAYSLDDVQSDFAKMRLALHEISSSLTEINTEEISLETEELDEFGQPKDIKSIISEQFYKLNTDVSDISARTNKLILTSEDSTEELKANLGLLKDYLDRVRPDEVVDSFSEIKQKLNIFIDLAHSNGSNINSVKEVLSYIGEWLDNAGGVLEETQKNVALNTDKIDVLTAAQPDIMPEIDRVYQAIANLEDKIGKIGSADNIRLEVDKISEKINGFESNMNLKFSEIDAKINAIMNDRELKALLEYIASQSTAANENSKVVGQVLRRLERLEEKFVNFEVTIKKLDKMVDND